MIRRRKKKREGGTENMEQKRRDADLDENSSEFSPSK